MPQGLIKFHSYVSLIPAEELSKEITELPQGRNKHSIYKKKPRSEADDPNRKKYQAFWHVKVTRHCTLDKLPMDCFGYLLFKKLFPNLIVSTQFKIRIWYQENKKKYIVASKHLSGFIPWQFVSSNITIEKESGKLFYKDVEVVGYGYIHLLSYLCGNIDLHSANFGLAPVFGASKKIIFYEVVVIDFDWCFRKYVLTSAVDVDHIIQAEGDRLNLPMPEDYDGHFYSRERYDLSKKVISERHHGYFLLLLVNFKELAEPDFAHPHHIQYVKTAKLLENRRQKLVAEMIKVPSILKSVKMEIEANLKNKNYSAVIDLIFMNDQSIVYQLMNDEGWELWAVFFIDSLKDPGLNKVHLIKFFAEHPGKTKLITKYIFIYLLTQELNQILKHYNKKTIYLISKKLSINSIARILSVHSELESKLFIDKLIHILKSCNKQKSILAVIKDQGVEAWLLTLDIIKSAPLMTSIEKDYVDATLKLFAENPELIKDILSSLQNKFTFQEIIQFIAVSEKNWEKYDNDFKTLLINQYPLLMIECASKQENPVNKLIDMFACISDLTNLLLCASFLTYYPVQSLPNPSFLQYLFASILTRASSYLQNNQITIGVYRETVKDLYVLSRTELLNIYMQYIHPNGFNQLMLETLFLELGWVDKLQFIYEHQAVLSSEFQFSQICNLFHTEILLGSTGHLLLKINDGQVKLLVCSAYETILKRSLETKNLAYARLYLDFLREEELTLVASKSREVFNQILLVYFDYEVIKNIPQFLMNCLTLDDQLTQFSLFQLSFGSDITVALAKKIIVSWIQLGELNHNLLTQIQANPQLHFISQLIINDFWINCDDATKNYLIMNWKMVDRDRFLEVVRTRFDSQLSVTQLFPLLDSLDECKHIGLHIKSNLLQQPQNNPVQHLVALLERVKVIARAEGFKNYQLTQFSKHQRRTESAVTQFCLDIGVSELLIHGPSLSPVVAAIPSYRPRF